MLSGFWDLEWKCVKSLVNAYSYYSLAPKKLPTWHAICAQLVEKKAIRPL
jgi:hypothetical protein